MLGVKFLPRQRKEIRGLFTALLTPFDAKGNVNHKALAKLVKFQIRSGINGLYVCGTTGLGPLLRVEERKAVAMTVVQESSGSLPVVIQVGCPDTSSAVELAKHAEGLGADAVASLTPYYYKPGDAAIQKHFETIANSVDVPLFAYNIPQFTGNNLRPELVASLARRRTIAGIKDSSRDVLQLLEILELVPEKFVVMNGTEEYGLYSLMMGGDGLVSGGANAVPELFSSLVSSFAGDDFKTAVGCQHSVLEFRDMVKASPIPAYYEFLRARGIDCGSPRPPFRPLGKEESGRLLKRMSSADIPLAPANG